MKALKTNPLALKIMAVLGFAILLANSSCNSQTNAGKKAEQKAASPKVDIHTAVLKDNLEALKQHVAAGSNLNEKDPYGGSSPLISAALFGKTDAVKILLDAGADINFQNNDGSTALHTAAFFCRTDIVRILLDKGADKTIKNKYGATPYLNVSGKFEEVKSIYQMLGTALEPMGLKIDYPYLEKTRPIVAEMLK